MLQMTKPSPTQSWSIQRLLSSPRLHGKLAAAGARKFFSQLAVARAHAAPPLLLILTRLAYESRWWALHSCTQQDALAATLVDDGVVLLDGNDTFEAPLIEALVDQLHCEQRG